MSDLLPPDDAEALAEPLRNYLLEEPIRPVAINPRAVWRNGRRQRLHRQLFIATAATVVLGAVAVPVVATTGTERGRDTLRTAPSSIPSATPTAGRRLVVALIAPGADDARRVIYFRAHVVDAAASNLLAYAVTFGDGTSEHGPVGGCRGDAKTVRDVTFDHKYPADGEYVINISVTTGSCSGTSIAPQTQVDSLRIPVGPVAAEPA